MEKILFVCLGNICRSPTAETVFRKKLSLHPVGSKLKVHFDSAGTAGYHVGEPSDSRSIQYAVSRGYAMTHLARQIQKTDFVEFDWIFAMDQSNFKNLTQFMQLHFPQDQYEYLQKKIQMVTQYLKDSKYKEIPDPYYGKEKDFQLVLDLLEECATNWLERF